MKPLKTLISLEEGLKILLSLAKPIERKEIVPLQEAHGRVLARDVLAEMDVPPFPRAAMDGYAVLAEDTFPAGTFTPVTLELVEVIHAGELAKEQVRKGICIQIATGCPIPEGTDAVVMVEDTEAEGKAIRVYKPVYPRQNVSPQGQDISKRTVILKEGMLLSPGRIGVLAALGIQKVEVYQKPRVAVIPSGNEIVPLGESLSPGKIYDVNSYTLSTLIEEHGGIPTIFPIMEDTLEAVHRTVKEALAYDLVVLSGGSSVGERDVMVQAIEAMGEVKFHGIAVKPGKPTLCGLVEGRLIIGMPGYPTSCLTNGYGFLVPVLRKVARLPERRSSPIRLPLSRRVVSTIGRHQYLPVRIEDGEAVPAFKESGAITSMALADGWVEIPANVDLVERGEVVEVHLF
ncbi:MAG: molybdenum cofactor biosynthesis protein [candidate division NC10 bacterium]|nr:molybdenum cofactor biosynthesis protein [candidate division NC10 bacterium]